MKWIVKTFKKASVDWVVFCGDFFNSRYSINVNTLNTGIELIQDLSYNFEKVILIEGNHDTYYKNTNTVNSVKFMKNLTKNDNIVVVDEKPVFANVGGLVMGFYPWGYDVELVKQIEGYETPDLGFGHFEMNGIEMPGGISSGNKYGIKDLFKLGDFIFSGHYHTNKIYKNVNDDRLLYMVGSPLQLTWADYTQDKKIVVYDTATKMMEEHINKVNSRFEKISYAKFERKEYTKDILMNLCSKNFVKFVIDTQYKFDRILKYNEIIKSYKPHSIEFDYLISMTSDNSKFDDENIKVEAKTNKDYLIEYIESIFPEYKKMDDTYDLELLKKLADSYFEKAMLPKEEREEQVLDEEEITE